jgi:hypothetical protein
MNTEERFREMAAVARRLGIMHQSKTCQRVSFCLVNVDEVAHRFEL